MKLLKVKDGHTFLSSISELRKEFRFLATWRGGVGEVVRARV